MAILETFGEEAVAKASVAAIFSLTGEMLDIAILTEKVRQTIIKRNTYQPTTVDSLPTTVLCSNGKYVPPTLPDDILDIILWKAMEHGLAGIRVPVAENTQDDSGDSNES